MSAFHLDPKTTALVLIDLQNGIVSRQTAPYSSAEVVENCRRMAQAFRGKNATVVYIRVDLRGFLQLPVDTTLNDPNAPPPPTSASELTTDSGFEAGDLLITKRHWGAFAGTELESVLRQRGVDTIVIGGISTNAGVESTVRQGTGLGFAFVVVSDACTSRLGAEAHRFSFDTIFPRLARVRTTDQVIASLA
jgi:nicotinamidase-related amidase